MADKNPFEIENPFVVQKADDNPFLVTEDDPSVKAYKEGVKKREEYINAVEARDPQWDPRFRGPKPTATYGEGFKASWNEFQKKGQSGLDTLENLLPGRSGAGVDYQNQLRDARNFIKDTDTEGQLGGKEQSLTNKIVTGAPQAAAYINPFTAGVMSLGAGVNTADTLKKQGVSSMDANIAGTITGAGDFATSRLPATVAGAPVKRALYGAAFGGAGAAVTPLATREYLKQRGYKKQAEAFTPQADDMAAGILAGAVIGPVAGSAARKSIRPNRTKLNGLQEDLKTPNAGLLGHDPSLDAANIPIRGGMERSSEQIARDMEAEKNMTAAERKAKAIYEARALEEERQALLRNRAPTDQDPLGLDPVPLTRKNLTTEKNGVTYDEHGRPIETPSSESPIKRDQYGRPIEELPVKQEEQGRWYNQKPREEAAQRDMFTHEAGGVGPHDPVISKTDSTEPSLPPVNLLSNAQQLNTFEGRGSGAGRLYGMTQLKGTPVEKLFANFANDKGQNTPEFREKMFKRADKEAGDGLIDPHKHVDSVTVPVQGTSFSAQVDAHPITKHTRVRLIDENGKVVAAAQIRAGMLDSMASLEKGHSHGEILLKFIKENKLGNVHEVPDRSPGFVSIQKKVLSSDIPKTASPLGGVGKKQGGAVDFGIGKKLNELLDARDKRRAEKAKAVDALNRGPIEGRVAEMALTDPEMARQLAEGAKDVNWNPVAERMRPGLRGRAAATKNPILRLTFGLVNKAEQVVKKEVRKLVTGEAGSKDHLDAFWKKMNDAERAEVNEALQMGDKNQVWLTDAMLRKNGFTDAQIGFVKKVYEIDKILYDKINTHRAQNGEEPMTQRKGHMPGIFDDDFLALVYKKDKDGNMQTHTMVGGASLLTMNKRLKDYTGSDYQIVKLPRRSVGSQMGGFAYTDGMSKIMEMLQKSNPELAQSAAQIIMDTRNAKDVNLFNKGVHELGKKGLEGASGRKSWRSDVDNAHDMYKSFSRYVEEGLKYHEYKNDVLPKVRKLIDDPAIDMPNAKAEATGYLNAALGEVPSLGKALNTVYDLLFTGGPLLGASHKVGGMAAIKNYMAQNYMGWGSLTFLLTQALQYPQTHVPQAMLLARRVGLNEAEALWHSYKGQADTLSNLLELINPENASKRLDDFDRAAFREMRDRNMAVFSEMERLQEASKHPLLRAKDAVAEFNMKLGELGTRPASFLSMVSMLKEARKRGNIDYTDQQIFDVAEHHTTRSMFDYNPTERARIYREMGIVGSMMGSLSTFKHGYMGFMSGLADEAFVRKNPVPLMAALATQIAMSGVMGFPFMEDLDQLWKAVSTGMSKATGKGYPVSLKEFLMSTVPNWASMGWLSDTLGYNVQSRFSAGNMVPDTVGDWISPYLSGAVKQAGAVGKWAAGGNKQYDREDMLNEVTPTSMKGLVKPSDEQGWTLKRGDRQYQRTPEQWDVTRALNLSPTEEAIAKHKKYMGDAREAHAKTQLTALTKEYSELLKSGELTQEKSKDLLTKIAGYKGTGGSVAKAAEKGLKNAKMGAELRGTGIPNNSPSSIRKYLLHKDYYDRQKQDRESTTSR